MTKESLPPDTSITDAYTLGDSGLAATAAAMPKAVGPYVLLERLGEGGMGVVVRAHDPRLDREVAIKLLRTDVRRSPGERARRRLVREARAMANVTHPNVVQVFDVGMVGEQVFVAMELVEGSTLTRWLRREPKTTAEIVGVFVQAGRGLQAAHDKGLVHRDFKPDNVLVGDDGRVRVTDFGLARAIEEGSAHSEREASEREDADAPRTAGPVPQQATRDDGLGALTRTGVAMGTPAYMALEQHLGEASDARTDQFAFCVALFEALAGHRPFAGMTDLELGRAKRAMALQELPSRKGLRPALRRAILRGLEADPAARWPSMAHVLAVLDPPARGWRRAAIGLGVLGVLAGGLWLVPWRETAVDRCEAGQARVQRVWGQGRQDAVAQALTATGIGYAKDTWQRVRGRVDDHVAQWQAAHHEVCTAARAPEATDARMHCLDARLARLEGLVATLEEADVALVEHAVELASSLRSPQECLDPKQADDAGPSAPTPALAQTWSRHADAAARVEVLLDAGRGRRALALAQTLVQEAEAADWPPLRANALLILGTALEAVDDLDAAEQALTEGYWLAHGLELDALAARSAAQLVWLMGLRRLDEAGAQQWARHARTSMERRGADHFVEVQLETALGGMYVSLGRPAPATAAYRRALERCRERDGDEHPSVALARSNLGAALAIAGDYEGALAQGQAALEIWTHALGEQHPSRASALDNIALAQARLGRFEEAVATQEEALALRRQTFDPDDLTIAVSLNNLGAFEESRGNYTQAEVYQREALARHEAALGEDDLRVEASRVNLGLAVLRGGRYDEARALAQRSVSMLERTAPEHPYLGHALVLLGSAAWRSGDADGAVIASEQALALCDGGVALDHTVCVEARYVLARALEMQPDGRARAVELARRVEQEVRSTPGIEPALERELRTWLAELDGEDVAAKPRRAERPQ